MYTYVFLYILFIYLHIFIYLLYLEAKGDKKCLDEALMDVIEAVWKNKWRLARIRQQLARGYKEVYKL